MAAARLAAALLAAAVAAAPHAARAAQGAARADRLARAWQDPQAVRTVFFVEGMSCRACTMLLDRHLNGTEGIYWARFNFPLRLLVVYHDQRKVSTGRIRADVTTGELRAVMTESYPASGYYPDKHVRVAAWKSGGLFLQEARSLPDRFRATLAKNQLEAGDPEHEQVVTEIVGEEVRRRILAEVAAAAGYASGPGDTRLPGVVSREFYYPLEEMKPTAIEAGIARFLGEKVLLGDDGGPGRARFDAWLRDLWKQVRLDFRPEYLEADVRGVAK